MTAIEIPAPRATSSGSVNTGNTIWVDAANGDDGTGTADRQDLPFLTLAAAITASASGDLIRVRGGTYAESGLTLPSGVDLTGDGWANTEIGDSTAVADIITFGGSLVKDVTVLCPAGAGLAGLKHTAGTGGIYSVNIAGDGGTGGGIGVEKTGTAKLIGGNIRCEQGGFASAILVDAGVLALDDVHFPNTAGQTIDEVLRVEGTGTFQGQGFNCGNTAAVDAVVLDGTGTCTIYNPNIFNVANAVHIVADGPTINFVGGKIEASLRTVWVDPLLTGTGTTVRALSTVLAPLFDFPPAAAVNTEFVLQFNQEATNTRDSRQRLIGADLALGFPELGSAFSVGKGAPYSSGINVITTDGTETMVGSVVTGGNQTDVTAAAASKSASTYTFQGTGTNNAIYFCSLRRDGSSTPLKHWGHIVNQVAAGVGGSYVFEVWDGAAWTEVGAMAVSVNEQYRYADQVFLRASSTEDLHYGIVASMTWAQATVNGVAGYYIRARVATALTTAPTFERVRFSESSTAFNKTGQRTARGLAKWRLVLGAVGFRWSGSGTANGSVAMGTGAVGWNHELDGGLLNSTGDDAYLVLALPQGICTAHPIKVKLLYGYQAFNAAPTIGIDLKLCEVVGNRVADPAGGITPITRTVAGTATTDATVGVSNTTTGVTMAVNTIARYEAPGIDIAEFYENDVVAIRVTLVNDGGGGGTDILLYGIEIEGLQFTDGSIES